MALTVERYVRATREAQYLLKLRQPHLVVDGRFGPKTKEAYDRADPDLRSAVDSLLRTHSTTVADLMRFRERLNVQAKMNPVETGGRWITLAEAQGIMRKACATLKRDDLADRMCTFLTIEPMSKVVGGVTYVRTDSQYGSFSGLNQMGRPAWKDAAAEASRHGVSLPAYEVGRYDPLVNCQAAVAYAIISERTLKKAGFPVTAQTLYGAHNQGPAGYVKYLRTGKLSWPKQSKKALLVMSEGLSQSRSMKFA